MRDFIVRNVSSYEGDETFLVGPSKRTRAVWEKLEPYFQEEQKKGVLAVDAKTPSTLLAHQAGYLDQKAGAKRYRASDLVPWPGAPGVNWSASKPQFRERC